DIAVPIEFYLLHRGHPTISQHGKCRRLSGLCIDLGERSMRLEGGPTLVNPGIPVKICQHVVGPYDAMSAGSGTLRRIASVVTSPLVGPLADRQVVLCDDRLGGRAARSRPQRELDG